MDTQEEIDELNRTLWRRRKGSHVQDVIGLKEFVADLLWKTLHGGGTENTTHNGSHRKHDRVTRTTGRVIHSTRFGRRYCGVR